MATAGPEQEGSSFLPQLFESGSSATKNRRQSSVDGVKRPGRVYRSKSVSNILDNNDELDRQLNDPRLAPHLHRGHGRDGLAEIVEFLRNHAPPPDNFMSLPDSNSPDAEERGRWARLRRITGRSKSMPRAPVRIRLPDSAVSGRTIDGHRHIAITIPIEAYPIGDATRTQYPVFPQTDSRPQSSSQGSVRTITNDRGTVTVLRTVDEDRESSSTSSASRSIPYSAQTRGSVGRQAEYTIVPPSRSSMVPRDLSRPSTARQIPRSAVSTRGSSKSYRQQPLSIDGILATRLEEESQPSVSEPIVSTKATYPKFDVESAATSANWPPSNGKGKGKEEKKEVNESTEGRPAELAADTMPGVVSDTQQSQEYSKESGAKILSENPLGGNKIHTPASSTPEIQQNRRDRVRSKKRRDMDALKTPRITQSRPSSDVEAMGETALSQAAGVKAATGREQPTLSPITVVADFSPSPEIAIKAPKLTEVSHPESRKSGLVPPNVGTPSRSPSRKPALDRTSLSRRREWRANREQERIAKETARAAVRVRAKQLTGAGAGSDSSGPEETHERIEPLSMDKDILRLYEVYREHRFRDMERRIRRLERHGDVWLRALIPVLDNLNHTMATSQVYGSSAELSRQALRPSDEEGPKSSRRRPGDVRRVTSLHRLLRERELSQRGNDGDTRSLSSSSSSSSSIYSSDTFTGANSLEPLIQKLAGAARGRLGARSINADIDHEKRVDRQREGVRAY
jgi:hypothetical protein